VFPSFCSEHTQVHTIPCKTLYQYLVLVSMVQVQMMLTPQQMGELRIYGLTYNLGSAATTFMPPTQGLDSVLGGAPPAAGPNKASYVSTVCNTVHL